MEGTNMMEYLLIPLWTAAQLGFARLFLGLFLEEKGRKEDHIWLTAGLWLLTTVYGFFRVQGFHGYLMYLLSVVLILLSIHGEYGAKGLCLLAMAFLIPGVTDMAAWALAAPLDGTACYLTVTGGKVLPLALVLVLRQFRLLPGGKQPQPDRDMLLLRQHMEMQQESMQALEQNYRLQRKNTHEFEHHLQVLRDLLDREEVGAAREYLDSLRKNRAIHTIAVSSNHPVVDVILNQKYQTARENDIKMQVRVNDLSALAIPTDSLVVVLTNLLDNALEACRRLDGYREIFCSVLYEDGLFISIRNTSEEVTIVDGKIPTSKEDSLSHGFGLRSVTYVLDKLEGEYTFGYDEGWFHFAAEIP